MKLSSHFSLAVTLLQQRSKGSYVRVPFHISHWSVIWNGSGQKKVVLREGLAQQPPHRGGLGSTHLENFWDSLKMSWLSRLFHANENCTWKKLAMSRLSHAMRIPNLTTNMLLEPVSYTHLTLPTKA